MVLRDAQVLAARGDPPARTSPAPARVGGSCAILAGATGFCYAVAFVLVTPVAPGAAAPLSALFLLTGGFLSTVALVAVYERLRAIEPSAALWALLLGVGAAAGSAIHGGYDLALAIHPPAAPVVELPSQVDPRGLLTFAVAGSAISVVSWLMQRSKTFPHGLAALGYLLAVLLVLIYFGRLVVLDPSSALILAPAALAGFVVSPAWYVWLGLSLLGRTGRHASAVR